MVTMPNPAASVSILLVEDEKVSLDLITMILSKKFPDIVLHSALNGRTGLELFKTYTPDIVITDFNMPEMNGAHMIDRIRALKPGTKCIVITGKSEKTDVHDLTEKGVVFDHFIAKPVMFQELFTAIEECLGEIAHTHRDQVISERNGR